MGMSPLEPYLRVGSRNAVTAIGLYSLEQEWPLGADFSKG